MAQTEVKIKSTMEVSTDEAQQKVQQTAKKSADKAQKEFKKVEKKLTFGERVKKQLDEAKKGIQAIGQSGDKLGKLGDFLSAGKLAFATAAIFALGKAVKSLWDDLTLSASEYLKKQQLIVKDVQEDSQKEVKQQNQDIDYMESLRELSQVESNSNQQKKYAISLIDELTKRYGDLGIAIDTATGKITGLDQAQGKILQKQLAKNLKNSQKELQAVSGLADKRMGMAFTQIQASEGTSWLFKFIQDEFGLVHKNVAQAMQYVSSMTTDQQIDFFTKIRNDHANSDAEIQAVQKVIDLKKKQLELEQKIKLLREKGAGSQAQYIKKLKQQASKSQVAKAEKVTFEQSKKQLAIDSSIDSLRETAEYSRLSTDEEKIAFWERKKKQQRNKQNNLRKQNSEIQQNRYGDEQEKARDYMRLQDVKTEIIKIQESSLTEDQKARKEEIERELQNIKPAPLTENQKARKEETERELQDLENSSTPLTEDQETRKAELEKELQKFVKFLSQSQYEKKAKLEAELKTLLSSGTLTPDQSKRKAQLEAEKVKLETKTYSGDAERAKDSMQISRNQTQIKKSQAEQLKIQIEIDKIKKRSIDFYTKEKSSLEKQLQIQKMLLQGKFEQAEKQKLINQLKSQGLNVDQKQVDEIMRKKKALAGVNIAKTLKQQGQNLIDQARPKDFNYHYEKRVRELEQANNVTLDQSQKDKVKTLVQLEMDLKNAESLKPDFSDLDIKTNEMTKRGGFTGGAVVPDTDKVNQQIRDYQAQSVTTLQQIRQILQRGGII